MTKTSETAAPTTITPFTFELETGISIPEDIGAAASRPNVLIDDIFTPALAKVLANEKDETSVFLPVSFFQQGSDTYAAKNGKQAKKLGISDVRQKVGDAFKKWQEKKTAASVVELLMANRTGKEAAAGSDAKATEPGVRIWVRMKKK